MLQPALKKLDGVLDSYKMVLPIFVSGDVNVWCVFTSWKRWRIFPTGVTPEAWHDDQSVRRVGKHSLRGPTPRNVPHPQASFQWPEWRMGRTLRLLSRPTVSRQKLYNLCSRKLRSGKFVWHYPRCSGVRLQNKQGQGNAKWSENNESPQRLRGPILRKSRSRGELMLNKTSLPPVGVKLWAYDYRISNMISLRWSINTGNLIFWLAKGRQTDIQSNHRTGDRRHFKLRWWNAIDYTFLWRIQRSTSVERSVTSQRQQERHVTSVVSIRAFVVTVILWHIVLSKSFVWNE